MLKKILNIFFKPSKKPYIVIKKQGRQIIIKDINKVKEINNKTITFE